MGRSWKGHAVVVPFPAQGHINPLLHLSGKLAHQGFLITFVNTREQHRAIIHLQRRDIPAHSDDHPHESATWSQPTTQEQSCRRQHNNIRFVALPCDEPYPSNTAGDVCRGISRMGDALEDLIRRSMDMRRRQQEEKKNVKRFHPSSTDQDQEGEGGEEEEEEEEEPPAVSFILSDVFMPYTQDVALKLGLPRVAFWTQSAASYACFQMVADGSLELTPGALHAVPGAPLLNFHDINNFLVPADASCFVHTFLLNCFHRLHEADWILLNTFQELEPAAIEALTKSCGDKLRGRIKAIGPVLPAEFTEGKLVDQVGSCFNGSLWQEDPDCMRWLDMQPEGSVVYVSFGSLASLSREEVEEYARGLEGLPVLWVQRPGLINMGAGGELAGLHQESSPDQLGSQERMRERDQWRSVRWAPQLQVLGHGAVGAFLTHGGWNSVLESMVAGKPMLVCPCSYDQMINSRCVQDLWKIGLSLSNPALIPTRVISAEVEAKVTMLLFSGANIAACPVQQLPASTSADHCIFDGGSSSSPHMIDTHRISDLQQAAKRAVCQGGSSHTNLQDFIRHFIS